MLPLAHTNSCELRAIPVRGIRDVFPGDDIADLIVDALALGGLRLHEGDILVVKHKIVSKAEGRTVRARLSEAVAPGQTICRSQWR